MFLSLNAEVRGGRFPPEEEDDDEYDGDDFDIYRPPPHGGKYILFH